MSVSSLTSVQAEETTCGLPSPTRSDHPDRTLPASYRDFLFRSEPLEAVAAEEFYHQVDKLEEKQYSFSLDSCRRTAWFVRNEDTGEVRVASRKCHLRWCSFCSQTRQIFITLEVDKWFSRVNKPKLLTLTLRHSPIPLADQISFLYESFRKLRKRRLLNSKIRGGVWFFQITFNTETETWHPHIHCLLDSEYIPHKQLSELWCKVTAGSTITHIKACHNPSNTVKHIARYAAKPTALTQVPMSRWLELYRSFKSRRLCGSWGNAKCVSLRMKKPPDADKWKDLGKWSTVIGNYETDSDAHDIVRAWLENKPLEEGVSLLYIDRNIAGVTERAPPEKCAGFQLNFF